MKKQKKNKVKSIKIENSCCCDSEDCCPKPEKAESKCSCGGNC